MLIQQIADKREFELEVLITRYDKGDAFVRFFGPQQRGGQIHIDANVSLFIMPEREKIAVFDIHNAVGREGGIYFQTSIEDEEEYFAKGVAEAITKIEE